MHICHFFHNAQTEGHAGGGGNTTCSCTILVKVDMLDFTGNVIILETEVLMV